MKKFYNVIFEDSDLLVLNKSAGLLTVPDRFDHHSPNLTDLLKNRYDDIYTVHRLDRDTSGLIIFAKNEDIHRELSIQFSEGKVEKRYQAIILGTPAEETGIIENNLVESNTQRGKMVLHKKGKYSKSQYKIVEAFGQYCLIEIQIFTGRMHQIRVHMSSIGHPLIADDKYGSGNAFYLSQIKKRKFNLARNKEERPLLSRQALHSYQLTITHPATDQKQTFKAELPKDMRATLQQLRKWVQ